MAIHVGIIDRDPIRLITPLFDNRAICEHIIFIGDKNQKVMFQRLKYVLDKRNIKTEFFEITSIADTPLIRQAIHQLETNLRQRGKELKLNASCGLRHRLLPVYEMFRRNAWEIFVVEPNSDKICWIYPEENKDAQLEDHITIADYLTIFGARAEFNEHDLPDQLYELGQRWAGNALELGPGLATLNYLATTCRKEQKLEVSLTEKQQGYREVNMLLSDLVDTQLATYQNGVLKFASEDARRFSNGEWLETLVHSTVKQIQDELPTIQDHSLNVQVYRQLGEREVRNELDVATVVNNKLHIIECKTKGMRDDGDDTLYKLESLRDLLGGLQARAMLVSFRPLRHNDITRAEDLGLALIGPDELKDLKKHLTHWFADAGGHDEL
ncbi:Card1-like endonuclease domain-containing protein [Vibrio sp. F74]|uniref:Card1-like endonuclease domain-containing protein n=1 Tax=Vibrio sp. F74 TaxID=700020 RepID=UPI0035F54731